jgi:protein-L-isoaspartate(D-aspartate) O-methyltransferase
MDEHSQARERMVDRDIVARGVRDPQVIAAMRDVPREAFVDPDQAGMAYDDRPLPIGADQTISQPYIVAFMLEAAGIRPGDKVLEVGAGSGYAAAVMARIADRVHAIERHRSLAEQARDRLLQLGFGNVALRVGDGALGWPEAAPFDVIIVSAGAESVPKALLGQLAPDGRMVIPVGAPGKVQTLVRVRRTGADSFEQDRLAPVSFVPLVGGDGTE